MIKMYSEKGGYMNAYNPKEVERLKSKGWTVVEDAPVVEAPAKKKAPVKRKPRAKK